MCEQKPEKTKKHICIGLLAHVDAGKTTLSEALLYKSGSIRSLGRVDRKTAFLDTAPLERERGITIFSKQAELSFSGMEATLLDTPGHADFSAEMERVLWVLDYAVLLISGADGIQSHTETLWKLLERYQIPTFLFVNKMDQAGTDRAALLSELQRRLSENCLDFTDLPQLRAFTETESIGGSKTAASSEYADSKKAEEDAAGLEGGSCPPVFAEAVAMCDEALLEAYLETGRVTGADITDLICRRRLFPCFFGSALKLSGIDGLLAGLRLYTKEPDYPEEFAARVFKIGRDRQGSRLSYLKITGGSLSVKTAFGAEKVNELRIYSGAAYRNIQEAPAGTVCAATGLSKTEPGMGLGAEPGAAKPLMAPVLSYQLTLPADCDTHTAYQKLSQFAEEDPSLQLSWEEETGEIRIHLMGEVQTEVLKREIGERCGISVGFSEGEILYQESIRKAAIGVGHFEPLRHYAEAELLLEPLPRGSGIVLDTDCSTDRLAASWQRLVLSHLRERAHPGVLMGAPLTDLRITLISGRAHDKHTEGGDFREASFRALRQGLMQAESVLLEPCYAFSITAPKELAGRIMTDIRRMEGTFQPPETEGEFCRIQGTAPVSEMRNYAADLRAFSGGRGKLELRLSGYQECHDAERVIAASGYDPERDVKHPAGSVFCAHGAGFYVPWDKVASYAHAADGLRLPKEEGAGDTGETNSDGSGDGRAGNSRKQLSGARGSMYGSYESDRELEAIFRRTFGETKREARESRRGQRSLLDPQSAGRKEPNSGRTGQQNWLLVDGYNIIHAWEELRELSELNFDAARARLLDILSNYQGYRRQEVLVVFDAYRVQGRTKAEVEKWHNVYVVYTKQAETADQYIAKAVQELKGQYHITVATSDRLVQLIILGQGALRISARELWEEIEAAQAEIRQNYTETGKRVQNRPMEGLFSDGGEARRQ